MKARAILFAAAVFLATSAHADEWHGRDKQLHFVGGAAIAAAVTAATKNEWTGFWSGTAAAVIKEAADEASYGGASYKDAVVTVIGALLGAKLAGWAITPNGFTYTRRINIF